MEAAHMADYDNCIYNASEPIQPLFFFVNLSLFHDYERELKEKIKKINEYVSTRLGQSIRSRPLKKQAVRVS